MSALLRNQRKISRTSSSFIEMKFYYALNQRRYLNLKSCSHQLTNLAAMSSANFHTALERQKHNESLFDTSNFYRNSFYSFCPARNIHIGRCLYETPSSKVEATVQTMKKQQKEKVDEMMKEVSNNAKAAAEADTIHAASSTSSSSSSSSNVDKQKSAAATATATMSKEKTQAESATANVPSTKAQDLKPVVVKKSLKTRIWEEIVHYYHGFRLLFIDINICRKLLWRVLNGKTLTRRENRLLVRTTSDLFRLIPFSVFIIVPFMELLLPLFIKFFPGMLPSTFQTSKEREDKLKQSLQVKLEMAKFLQKTLDEMAVQHKEHRSEEAKQFADFFKRIKDPNEYVTKDEIIKYASRFKDEITLDSLSREQLSALCRLLELNTMGTSNFLRFQLRMKLRSLAADDRVISREGVQSLDLYELQQACKARGMRAYGLTTERLHAQLQEWIDLSLNEKVPPTLLLLSRAIFISDHHTTTDKLKEIIRVLPDSVAAETKAAIGELEGKIDNKTKIEVIKEEERKIKEEQEEEREEEKAKATEAAAAAAAAEVLLDKAPTIADDSIKTKSAMQIELPSRAADKPLKSTTTTAPAAAAAGAAPTSSEQAEDNTISSKDVELLSEALKTLSSATKKMIVEKEQIKDIKEELEDYKEDVEELHEVRNVVKEPVTESRAAKLLFKKVNKMIGQLDKVLDDLEKKQKQIQQGSSETVQQEKPTAAETAPLQHRQEEIVHVAELMEAIKKVKQTSTESRLKQIENVLSKLDADKDGVVTVNEVINVIEAIGRENVKLDEKQIEEVITLLDKEQMIQAEEKIEKALAKSIKESDMVKAKKEQQRRAELEELKDTAPELKDNAIDLEPPSKYDESCSTQQQASKTKMNPCNGTAKKSPKASVMQPTETPTTPTTTPLPNASSTPKKPNSKDKML